MNKQEFLTQLRKGLSGLPQDDIEERLAFYSEMIDDRMEDGLSEEDAVSEIGNVDEIISQIITDIPLAKLVKEKIKPKRTLSAWEIVLLTLGCPIWLSLLLATVAVIFSVYIVLWSAVVCLWSIEAALLASSLVGILSVTVFVFKGNGPAGLAMLGIGIACAGLSIFLFFGCKSVTKGILLLTKKIALGIKSLFVGKENVK